MRSTEVESVRGSDGGCSAATTGSSADGGEEEAAAISSEGLEQLPTAARDNDPRCEPVAAAREVGDGGSDDPPPPSSLSRSCSPPPTAAVARLSPITNTKTATTYRKFIHHHDYFYSV